MIVYIVYAAAAVAFAIFYLFFGMIGKITAEGMAKEKLSGWLCVHPWAVGYGIAFTYHYYRMIKS